MRQRLSRRETFLLLACTVLCAVAVFAPPLANPPGAHDFADRRALWGVPHALDVLSNLPFLVAGLWGFLVLKRVPAPALASSQRACARLFFLGLLLTAAGSAWYHLAPADPGLAVDRGAMAVAFAGLLGLLAAATVSERAGRALALALLVLGPASVLAWLVAGNVLPWALVQFGGMAILLALLALPAGNAPRLPVRWSLVLLAYALAKLLEANDHAILAASGQLFSGHTLKHVAAAFAAWPVIAALVSLARPENAPAAALRTA